MEEVDLMANIEALDRALAAIDADPDSWNQGSWAYKTSCGTAYCVAGWAAVQAGGQMIWGPEDDETGYSDAMLVRLPSSGTEVYIEDFAQSVLDLTDAQAGALFGGSNTRAELQLIRDMLAADPDVSAEDLGKAVGAAWAAKRAACETEGHPDMERPVPSVGFCPTCGWYTSIQISAPVGAS
jgi:hypothetical protein